MPAAGQPDYQALDALCKDARERFPDALEVRPVWYECRPLAEVFTERGRAFVYDPERES